MTKCGRSGGRRRARSMGTVGRGAWKHEARRERRHTRPVRNGKCGDRGTVDARRRGGTRHHCTDRGAVCVMRRQRTRAPVRLPGVARADDEMECGGCCRRWRDGYESGKKRLQCGRIRCDKRDGFAAGSTPDHADKFIGGSALSVHGSHDSVRRRSRRAPFLNRKRRCAASRRQVSRIGTALVTILKKRTRSTRSARTG
jgi:hypothetical protein